MKNAFLGYYRTTIPLKQRKEIWESATFVFDTNVWLRIIDNKLDKHELFLTLVLDQLKDRVWMPFQIATEYHRHIPTHIQSRLAPYDEIIKSLETVRKKSNHELELPSKKLKDLAKNSELLSCINELKNLRHKTERTCKSIVSRIADIFTNKIGEMPDYSLFQFRCQLAELRYKQNIPPGYKDAKTKAETGNAFGDALLWLELLEYASSSKSHIVFVTQEKKTDWWLERPGAESLIARPELAQEMKITSSVEFMMYGFKGFLEDAHRFLKLAGKEKEFEEMLKSLIQPADVDAISDLSVKDGIELASRQLRQDDFDGLKVTLSRLSEPQQEEEDRDVMSVDEFLDANNLTIGEPEQVQDRPDRPSPIAPEKGIFYQFKLSREGVHMDLFSNSPKKADALAELRGNILEITDSSSFDEWKDHVAHTGEPDLEEVYDYCLEQVSRTKELLGPQGEYHLYLLDPDEET
ncbi:MAG: PIN domain-containing protein [Candidatus Obscuribacterales bacterium]|nr:PIN domain-containing protein [Candidatus Obscuribacterales bacterium]